MNVKTDEQGWRIIGLWGDEDKGEGYRIGPTFAEDQLESCEKLAYELETQYGLPVEIATIISHFTGIKVGQKVQTKDGDGIVEEIRPGAFPFLIRFKTGTAWQDMTHIISVIA